MCQHPAPNTANLYQRFTVQSDITLPFLGACEVCGKISHNYNALSQHLNRSPDDKHKNLKVKWECWRSEYKANLRCRKCGVIFTVFDKKQKDRKRCPKCELLLKTIGKKQYEGTHFEKKSDIRYLSCRGSKADMPIGYKSSINTDDFEDVAKSILAEGGGIADLIKMGVHYEAAKKLISSVLGVVDYHEWVLSRKKETLAGNREKARTSSNLEEIFVAQMKTINVKPCSRNAWLTLNVKGQAVHREADIKVNLKEGRKAIILCDGEAFHGTKCIYGDPAYKIESDRDTALAMFQLGYTVLRYSESEIKNGFALKHLEGVLNTNLHMYRNWCPEETMYGGRGP